jgi:hypothetical protein
LVRILKQRNNEVEFSSHTLSSVDRPFYRFVLDVFLAADFFAWGFEAVDGLFFLNIWSQFAEYLVVVPLCKTVMALSFLFQ